MRRWGLAFCLSVVVAPVVALAQSSRDAVPPPQAVGYAAMPGGLHAPSAETLTKGVVEVSTYGGFGQRKSLLGSTSKFTRGLGSVGVAFAPTSLITVGLSLDGYFDKHDDGSHQDGFVGNPNLVVRIVKPIGNLRVGGQLGIWVPGGDAPSVKLGATTVDARALLALKAGPGWLSFSGGYRLDNSYESVDDPMSLTPQDRVSLGVSEFDAVLAGVHLGLPLGAKAFVNVEGTVDYFVGEGVTPSGGIAAHEAPGALFRFGGNVGYHLTDQYALFAFVEGSKVPHISSADRFMDDIRLIPYTPTIAGGLGFSARFGGPKPPAGDVTRNRTQQDIPLDAYADVSGVVVDDTGAPLAGAKVEVKLKSRTGTAVTDAQGAWKIEKLTIGHTVNGVTTLDDAAAEITVALDGKKPARQTLVLAQGGNAIAPTALDPDLPPGQILGLVRGAGSGSPIAGATITVEPGGYTATTDAEGNFTIAVPPGEYKVKATAPGLKQQILDAKVEINAPVLKNFELRK
jgi:hypothetical protein